MSLALLRYSAGSVRFAAAGMPPLLVHRVASGEVEEILLEAPPLGVAYARPYPELRSRVDEGPQGRCSVVDVADAGPGIPPEQVEQIFDPFFTTKDSGSGLGLFIAHRIMSDHGGAIVTRPRPGGGTVFSLWFPAAAEQRDATG